MMKYLCFAICTILIPSAVACLPSDAAAAPMQEEVAAEIAVVDEGECPSEAIVSFTAPLMEFVTTEMPPQNETVVESKNEASEEIELPRVPFRILEELAKGGIS